MFGYDLFWSCQDTSGPPRLSYNMTKLFFSLKAVVVIMDQAENDIRLLHDASGALKARDAALFVVGVGSGMDDPSVKKVASKNDYAFHVTSFSQLMSVAPLLADQICLLKGMLKKAPAFASLTSLKSRVINDLLVRNPV